MSFTFIEVNDVCVMTLTCDLCGQQIIVEGRDSGDCHFQACYEQDWQEQWDINKNKRFDHCDECCFRDNLGEDDWDEEFGMEDDYGG
jgi:hypothetical protein